MTHQSSMIVIYDGECPFCSNYVRLMALRKTVGRVELVNARQSHPFVRDLQTAGYDLNEGMAVIFGGKIYYGYEAVTLLSRLSDTSSVSARALSALLRDPARARRIYPWMRLCRNLTLKALGRTKIADAKPELR